MNKKTTRTRSMRQPIDADRIVAGNVRRLRLEAGLTLHDLSSVLGISHQQLQKYEIGANRISAGMLHALAKMFSLPVDVFFKEQPDPTNRDVILERARHQCRAIVNRTSSRKRLADMAKVMRSMTDD